MGVDYTVAWDQTEQGPSLLQLRQTLEDYLGALGIVTDEGHASTLFAAFISPRGAAELCKGSFPLARVDDLDKDYRDAQAEHCRSRERWFEVAVEEQKVVITTRQQDEFTGDVAKGFAKLIARYWKGSLKLPT